MAVHGRQVAGFTLPPRADSVANKRVESDGHYVVASWPPLIQTHRYQETPIYSKNASRSVQFITYNYNNRILWEGLNRSFSVGMIFTLILLIVYAIPKSIYDNAIAKNNTNTK